MSLLSALLLFAGVALSQPQPQPLIGAPYRDFSGGYVDYVDPSQLQPNQSPDLLNVVVDDPPGSLKPRPGFQQCGITPTGTTPTVLYEFNYNSGGGVSRFIVSDSSVAWQTQDCVSFTTVTTRLAGGRLPSVATVRDRVWFVNRSTHVITWNGSSESILDGRANTPNPAPPKANYIEFWNERVWLARTDTNPSGVYFSDLTDTNGNDLDPSTGTLAWPADNVIQIAQENGSPIYGIKVYRNAMYVFKENGIWRIDFNGPFDITVSKTLSSVGTRYQTSIVEHDNLLYFLGVDGIYAFDGDRAVRVSDNFRNKFNEINQTSVNEGQKTWDTTTDFDAGDYSSTTANDISGSITISSRTSGIAGGDFEQGLGEWKCISGGNSINYDCGAFNSTDTLSGSAVIGNFSARTTGNSFNSDSGTLYIFTAAGSTIAQTGATIGSCTLGSLSSGGSVSTYTVSCSGQAGQSVYLHFTGSGGHLYSPAFTIGTSLTFQYSNNASQGILLLDNFQSQLYFSSGCWTSEIHNLVEVSSFSTFDVESQSNGGSFVYGVRVGTDTTAITQNAYQSITPGALISGTTADIYVQVTATLTAVSTLDQTPELQNITVNTVRGSGSSQAVYSFSFGGNLYVNAATGTATTNNITFVKSRRPLDSWTLYDWRIGPMTEFNDRFYAGASTHSAINRMNYGTNDGGKAISWYWQSRDDTFERPNIRKYLMELNLDYRKGTETSLSGGYSRDGGTSFTNRTVDASGSGRGTARFFMAGSNSLDYRFRVGGSTLDGTVTILGITGWARPAFLRE